MTHFANFLPLVPMPISTSPSSNDSVKVIAFKTVPSATKLEIKNFLQSFYGLDVQKVRTLNMKGKKKHHGRSLIAKPDYKKAYVTLNKPLPVSSNLYPFATSAIEEEEENENKKVLTMQS